MEQPKFQFEIWKICEEFLKQNFLKICSTVVPYWHTKCVPSVVRIRQKLYEKYGSDLKNVWQHPDISHCHPYYELCWLQAAAQLKIQIDRFKKKCNIN